LLLRMSLQCKESVKRKRVRQRNMTPDISLIALIAFPTLPGSTTFGLRLARFLPASTVFALTRANRAWLKHGQDWKRRGVLKNRIVDALHKLGHGQPFLHALESSH